MALIIGNSIRRKEFGDNIPNDDLEIVIRSAKAELATLIKGEGIPKGTRLLKAYATSPKGARRIVFSWKLKVVIYFFCFIVIRKIRLELT